MSTEVVAQNEVGAITHGPFRATVTGLIVADEDVPFELWEAYGLALQRVEGAIQWVIGDWLNYGEERYGEEFAQAIDATGHGQDSQMQMKWVSNKVAIITRVQALSWSHHREVARLEPKLQAHWLQEAIANNYTVRELRNAIRADAEEIIEQHEEAEAQESEDWKGRALLAEERLFSLQAECKAIMRSLAQGLGDDPQAVAAIDALMRAVNDSEEA